MTLLMLSSKGWWVYPLRILHYHKRILASSCPWSKGEIARYLSSWIVERENLENVTPKIGAETDRFSLSEHYGRTLKATQEGAFLRSHYLPDFDSFVAAQSKVEKLMSEL